MFGKQIRIKHKKRWNTRIVSTNGYLMIFVAAITIVLFCIVIALMQNIKLTPISVAGWKHLGELILCNVYQFFSLNTDSCNTLYKGVSRDWTLLPLYVFRTIAIALLLSVIVVKLLSHKDLFEKRPTLCFAPTNENNLNEPDEKQYWEKGGGWELRCRLYNGTQLTLLNLNFIAKLRRPRLREGDWSLTNSTLELTTKTWAVALPFVPLSIRIPLQKDDLKTDDDEPGKLSLNSIQGHPFLPQLNEERSKAKSFLVINIDGTIDESDGHMLESLWWPIEDESGWYNQGREKPINVHPGTEPLSTSGEPDSWQGWEDFEDGVINNNYVFGYGSLMGEWMADGPYFIANLKGYDETGGSR